MYITDIKVNDGCKLPILSLIKLTFFRAYPYLKPHTLLNSNGLANWHGFPDITQINVNDGCKSVILKFFMDVCVQCEVKFCSGNENVDGRTTEGTP